MTDEAGARRDGDASCRPARQRGPGATLEDERRQSHFIFQKPPSCTKSAFVPFVHELSFRDGEVSPLSESIDFLAGTTAARHRFSLKPTRARPVKLIDLEHAAGADATQTALP
jgi:hypothetical protein